MMMMMIMIIIVVYVWSVTTDHPQIGVVCNFALVVCQTIPFETLNVGSSYLHSRYIFKECGSS